MIRLASGRRRGSPQRPRIYNTQMLYLSRRLVPASRGEKVLWLDWGYHTIQKVFTTIMEAAVVIFKQITGFGYI